MLISDGIQLHRTRNNFRVIISVVIFATLGLGVLSPPASAQGSFECESDVVDDGVDIDVIKIENAISRTVADGPRYVIRSFETVPNADLDTYLNQIIAACSFGGPGGDLADDIVMFSVSRGDRLSAVDVGDAWDRAIPASERDWIRTEVMSPGFLEDDYTGGIVDAIAAADQLIVESEVVDSAPSDLDTENSEAVADGQVATDLEEAPPADEILQEGSDSAPLYAVIGALLLIILGALVFALVNGRRRLAALRQTLEKSLSGPQLKIGALRERFGRLNAQADVWERTTAGRTKSKLRSLMRETIDTNQDAERSAAMLTATIPDGVENASTDELHRARISGVAMSKALEAQERELDRLTAFGAHLDHLRIALPTKKELLSEELAEVEVLAAGRQSDGWDVASARSRLIGIEERLTGVSFNDLELDLLSLSSQVEQAEAELFSTSHHLESLPNQVESLQTWNTELDEAADLEIRRIDALRDEFSLLAHIHASDSWDWAVDKPEQALEELELAHQRQEEAIAEHLQARELEAAGKSLEEAGLHLMQADRTLDEVDDLLVDLQQARIESPQFLAQADEILDDLTNFVAANAADVAPEFQNEPAEFAGALAGIRTELDLERPNYLRVAETLDRINRRLDETLARARDAHARAQALRREADREVARADRTLRRAERALGWELIPSRDARLLDRLREALADLPDVAQQRIIVAANIADGALQVQERIIARRRRRRTAGAVTSAGGGFGSGWSGGSGSQGSSWSQGGGRSSGGRSFGGGISRGGRSFGGGRSSGSF